MPRYLALDWNGQHLHLAAGDTGRKGVRVDKAWTWALPEELKPATAESLGRRLRDELRGQGIAPAPVLALIGRDRVILKDLHFPAVSAAEEPGLVRFQATKDMADAPEDIALDYAHMPEPAAVGERHAMAVMVRRDIVLCLQNLCKGLGVKLAAVAPRPYGLAGAWMRSGADGAATAVLTIGARLAELAVVQERHVLFARSLAVGATLAGEVKRSLAVFALQMPHLGPIQAVSIAGNGEHDLFRARLEEVLAIPVRSFDPFSAGDAGKPGENHGAWAAAIGMLHLWGVAGTLPVNFQAPKQGKPVGQEWKRQRLVYGLGAAVLALAVVIFAYLQIDEKRKEVARLTAEKVEWEQRVKAMAQDRLDVDFLKDWDRGTISWPDEFYDMAAHFPQRQGFRLKQLTANVIGKKATGKDKDKYVASVSLLGFAPAEEGGLAYKLADSLNRDGHRRATVEHTKVAGGQVEFTMKVDVGKLAPGQFNARLTRWPSQSTPPPAEVDDSEGGQP